MFEIALEICLRILISEPPGLIILSKNDGKQNSTKQCGIILNITDPQNMQRDIPSYIMH